MIGPTNRAVSGVPRAAFPRRVGAGAWFACLASLVAGCTDPAASVPLAVSDAAGQQAMLNVLFDNAVGMWNELDRYDAFAVMPQVVGRLSQWSRQQPRGPGWKPDPWAVPSADDAVFGDADIGPMLEVMLLREIARHATRDATTDPQRIERLFDWTVRNIGRPAERSATRGALLPSDEPPQLVWETLLLGSGQAADRLWVFMLLARQAGLDVVLLADEATATRAPRVAAWLCDDWWTTHLVGPQVYLFDCAWGVPLPTATGQGVATLAEAHTDPRVLGQLAGVPGSPPPPTAQQLAAPTPWIEASAFYLTERAHLLEARLRGRHAIVLTARPAELAARLARCAHLAPARMWSEPRRRAERSVRGRDAQAIQERLAPLVGTRLVDWAADQPQVEIAPRLLRARVRHLFGKIAGDDGANADYLRSRPADALVARAAAAFEASLRQRALDAALGAGFAAVLDPSRLLPPGSLLVEQLARGRQAVERMRETVSRAKPLATLGLGRAAFDRRLFAEAIDWFALPLVAREPAAPFNLARAHEELAAEAATRGDQLLALAHRRAALAAYRSAPLAADPGSTWRARQLLGWWGPTGWGP